MGLFGDKKKGSEPIHTLTEKEIQARLYGTFRAPQSTASDVPMVAPPSPKGNGMQSHDFMQGFSRTQQKTAKPDYPRPTVVGDDAGKDLFKMNEAAQDSFTRVQPGDSVPVLPKASWADRKKGGASFSKALEAKAPKKPAFNFSASRFFSAAGRVLKSAALKGLAGFGWAFRFCFRLILAVDFRKPLVRRLAYGIGIVAVLVFLFSGIQSLNGKREAAMKNPPKPAAKKVQAKQAKPAQPASNALRKSDVKKAPAAVKETKVQPPAAQNTAKAEPAKPAAAKKPKTEAPATAAAVPASQSVQAGSYSIQIATFAAREDAEALLAKLKLEQVEAYIRPLNRSGGRVYFCVFAGRFGSSAEAENRLDEFKKKDVAKPFQDAFVRSVPAA